MMYRTFYNSKTADLVPAVIKSEDLELTYRIFVDALGDTVIEVRGPHVDVSIFKKVFLALI